MPDPLTVVTTTSALPAPNVAGSTAQPAVHSTPSLSQPPATPTHHRNAGTNGELSNVALRLTPERVPLDESYAVKTGILNPPSANLALERVVDMIGEINHWPRVELGHSQTLSGDISPATNDSASLHTVNSAVTDRNPEDPLAAHAFSQTLDNLAKLNTENIEQAQALSRQAADVSIWAAKLELVTTALSKASQSLNHLLRIQ